MNTEILPYQRLRTMGKVIEKTKGKNILNLLSKDNLILLPLAFLLGRASLAGGIMPFGAVIYFTSLGFNINRLLVAAAVLLGMVSKGAGEQVYVTVIAMLLFNAINIPFKTNKPNANFRYAVISFVSILIPEFVMVYLQGFLLYDLLKALLHSFIVFSLVFIFRNVMMLIIDGKKKPVLTGEEMISFAITAALAVSGLGDIHIFFLGIKNIICIFVILLFSFRCGAGVGSAVGVTIGLIVSMSDTATPLLIGSYAFCGLLSGVLRQLGKVGSSLGFVMGNAILTIYLNGSTEVLIYLNEIIVAVLIFMITPQKFMDMLAAGFNREVDVAGDKKSYSARIREITVEKLNKFSNAFKELSKTFNEISETKVVTDKQDISALFDRVADKVCKDCSLCLHCWDRNFYNTYQVMFKVVERLDAKGRIEESDIPDYFMDRCERINEFVESINNIYELFKVDMVWKNKIGESRGLVSQQLEGLSKVISDLASEIDVGVYFKGDLEDSIAFELEQSGVKVNDVVVYENKWGKYEVTLFHKGCGGKRSCLSTMEKVVSNVVGRKMTKEGNDCYKQSKDGSCALRLVEEEEYKIITGVAKAAKHGSSVSGDNYTFLNTGTGKYVLALSDGMGSGHKAASQSRAAINLLEQFMESGFDKDTTVKLINSILVLKSNEESFATIDLSLIDLYGGEVEFVKIGTGPTFIKRSERVELVKSASLPAGILSNIEVELVQKKVDNGDYIIMATDGILDAFKKEEDGDKALQKFIQEIRSTNPQEIADSILDRAYANCDGEPIDDMMVLVAKVWMRVD